MLNYYFERYFDQATCKEYGQEVRAAIAEERAARDLLKAKRQEMDSVQSTMNRLNNAISVGDIDSEVCLYFYIFYYFKDIYIYISSSVTFGVLTSIDL